MANLNRYPHLKNPQYLNQSLWSSELLLLAKKLLAIGNFRWQLFNQQQILLSSERHNY